VLYISPDPALRLLDTPFQSRDPKLVALDTSHHLVAGLDVERLAKGSRETTRPLSLTRILTSCSMP